MFCHDWIVGEDVVGSCLRIVLGEDGGNNSGRFYDKCMVIPYEL